MTAELLHEAAMVVPTPPHVRFRSYAPQGRGTLHVSALRGSALCLSPPEMAGTSTHGTYPWARTKYRRRRRRTMPLLIKAYRRVLRAYARRRRQRLGDRRASTSVPPTRSAGQNCHCGGAAHPQHAWIYAPHPQYALPPALHRSAVAGPRLWLAPRPGSSACGGGVRLRGCPTIARHGCF